LGHFLKGRFSLKNGTFCPFSHDTTYSKGTCFFIAASGANGGEISEKVASTQKRTHPSLNSAQASGNKSSTQKSTTNIAQAGSIGVAKGVANDSKQAQTQHLTVRGLFETFNTRATNI
jgi:hypothetical protein